MDGYQQALEQACAVVGLDAGGARLLRFGSNAVYHLAAPVIVRVSRPGADLDAVRRTVQVARWLEAEDYPAIRLIDVEQPVTAGGHGVTFWQSVSDSGDQFASTAEKGVLLARLHQLTAPDSLHLPALAHFAAAARRIDANTWLSPDDRDFLTTSLDRLHDGYDKLDFVLPPGVIHGDASVGNVLRDPSGAPVLIDLDSFSVGPREWDLLQTAMYYDSFGWLTGEEYEAFAAAYGYDIRQWPGYPLLREIREFLMVAWVIQQAADNPRAAAEAAKRIGTLRTGASRKDWRAY
jgi:hypothetical protein